MQTKLLRLQKEGGAKFSSSSPLDLTVQPLTNIYAGRQWTDLGNVFYFWWAISGLRLGS